MKVNGRVLRSGTITGTGSVKVDDGRTAGVKLQRRQLVRDKIVSIIMKAGWTIEYRPRKNRRYRDAVYVDLDGSTNWSCTKAYFSLKSKIENETATSQEVSAYTPIPDVEMSVLFRTFSKVSSNTNVKKQKRRKNVSEAEIIFSGEAPPPKKKPGKKKKDGKKKKEINKSADKLPCDKVRGPKVTQKGRQIRKPRLVASGSNKGSNKENVKKKKRGKNVSKAEIILCGLVEYGASQNEGSHDAPNPDMLTCSLCEGKFHYACFQNDSVAVDSTSLLFCGKKCQQIHEQLQTYVAVKFELENGDSWTLFNRSDVSQAVAILDDQQNIECDSKLAVAFSVMDECFEPTTDE